jgi:hypothetical protein
MALMEKGSDWLVKMTGSFDAMPRRALIYFRPDR